MVKAEKKGDVKVLSFENLDKLNILVAQQVKDALKPHVNESNAKIILSLEGVKYVDSSGFGVLLSILRSTKKNKSGFRMCNISPEIMELIRLLKLDSIFEIDNDVEESYDKIA